MPLLLSGKLTSFVACLILCASSIGSSIFTLYFLATIGAEHIITVSPARIPISPTVTNLTTMGASEFLAFTPIVKSNPFSHDHFTSISAFQYSLMEFSIAIICLQLQSITPSMPFEIPALKGQSNIQYLLPSAYHILECFSHIACF